MSEVSCFSVLTVFSPKDDEIEEVRSALMLNAHPIPIYVDVNKSFCRLNKDIPYDPRFRCFLINDEGAPIFVGNPVASAKLKELFLTTLTKINNL